MSVLKKYIVTLSVFIAVTALSACETSDSPELVSQKFWAAIEAGNTEQAQDYAIAGSLEGKSLSIEKTEFKSEFGETIIDNQHATVTTIHKGDHNGAPLNYEFHTVLVQVDGQWKVDIDKTTESLVPAAMSAAFSGLGQALNQSLTNLSEAFGQEADNIGSLLGQALNQGIEQMSREMEKASAELGQSAEQASTSGLAAAAQMTKELSQEFSKELNNAGSIYQQKVNEFKAAQQAAQLKKQQSKALPASIQGHIHNAPVNFTKARYQQALELYSGDNWSHNPSALIFLFLDEGENLAGRTISYSANATSAAGNQPHIHLRWLDPATKALKTEVITKDYNLQLAFSEADTNGSITATLSLSTPQKDNDIHGSFQISNP